MLALSRTIDLVLNNDIKNKINLQLNEIKDSFSWDRIISNMTPEDIMDVNLTNESCIEEINTWKRIAKLSVDLWRDYEYYRQFRINSKFCGEEYGKTLIRLGFKSTVKGWQSVSRPNLQFVQRNIFIYCLCVYKTENQKFNEEIRQNKENEQKANIARISSSNDKGQTKEVKLIERKSVVLKHNNISQYFENDIRKMQAIEEAIQKPSSRKWSCQSCSFENEESLTKCQCCHKRRTYLYSNETLIDKRRTLEKDTKIYYKNNKTIDQIPKNRNERIINSNKKIELFNQSLTNYLPSYSNISINSKTRNNNHKKWSCTRKSCNYPNTLDIFFCAICYVSRYRSITRGSSVKVVDVNNKVMDKWICYKCDYINDIRKGKCNNAKCRATRYPKVKCRYCSTKSEGTSKRCLKCENVLHV